MNSKIAMKTSPENDIKEKSRNTYDNSLRQESIVSEIYFFTGNIFRQAYYLFSLIGIAGNILLKKSAEKQIERNQCCR